jgi:hypothetical protein
LPVDVTKWFLSETIVLNSSCKGHCKGEYNNQLLWGIFNNQLDKNRYLARTRDDEDTDVVDVVRTTWHYTTINLTSTRDITRRP